MFVVSAGWPALWIYPVALPAIRSSDIGATGGCAACSHLTREVGFLDQLRCPPRPPKIAATMDPLAAFPPQVLRDYALLADGERGALIGPQGDLAWLCVPHWDSDAVFSTLIGGAGCYALTPIGRFTWGGYYCAAIVDLEQSMGDRRRDHRESRGLRPSRGSSRGQDSAPGSRPRSTNPAQCGPRRARWLRFASYA